MDRISYRRGHRYLTVVADHEPAPWCGVARDRTKEAFHSFFDALGEQRSQALTAVTCDAAGAYRSVAQVRAVTPPSA